MKRYNFTGTINTRDLGGNPTKDGFYTRFHAFIRSDAPLKLSVRDLQMIKDFGITTVIDLRAAKVVKLSPNSFFADPSFNCINYAIADVFASSNTESEFVEMYFQMTCNKQVMSSLFKTMANCDGGVFFHCQEGKDRSGVISAVLLSLANVFEADICADYQVSSTYFRDYTRKALQAWKDMPAFLTETRAEYMEMFLELFHEKYSSAKGYLQQLGLSDLEIKKLKMKLIDTNCGG